MKAGQTLGTRPWLSTFCRLDYMGIGFASLEFLAQLLGLISGLLSCCSLFRQTLRKGMLGNIENRDLKW